MADEVLKRDENYIPVAGGLTNDANLEIKALRVDPTSKRLLTNDSGTTKSSYGTHTALTITNLNSLASSQTAGWQSIRISNLTNLAVDYEIAIKLTMADTAPANDKAVYVYISPAYYDGSAWYQSDGGTATLPSGEEGTYTIALPNNLKLLGSLNYTTQKMVLQGVFYLTNTIGNTLPDGFSIIIVNYSGAAIAATGNMVAYKPINYKNE